MAGRGSGRDPDVFSDLGHVIHAGQDHIDFLMVPDPAKAPFSRAPFLRPFLKGTQGFLRQAVHQAAAPQRFHNDYRDLFLISISKALDPGLGMLIHIVELDLTEIPVIGVDQFLEFDSIAMEGEAYIADLSLLLFLFDPLRDPQPAQAFPGGRVIKHVHQIIIHMVRFEPFQLLREILFRVSLFFEVIMGQLGSHMDLVTAIIFLHEITQTLFTARIDVGCIKVIDTLFQGQQHFPLCLLQIDPASFSGKAHAAITKDRESVPVPAIDSVLHIASFSLKECGVKIFFCLTVIRSDRYPFCPCICFNPRRYLPKHDAFYSLSLNTPELTFHYSICGRTI